MKWFTETFLPSLEERYNARGGRLWITKKQADVCRRYMEFGAVRGAMQHRRAASSTVSSSRRTAARTSSFCERRKAL